MSWQLQLALIVASDAVKLRINCPSTRLRRRAEKLLQVPFTNRTNPRKITRLVIH